METEAVAAEAEDEESKHTGADAEEVDSESQAGVPIVTICELEVDQQVGNTCAPAVLLIALWSFYTREESSDFACIDPKATDKGGVWIDQHLAMYDTASRLCVVDSISLIADAAMHPILLSSVLSAFIGIDAYDNGSTSFGLIVSTGTAAENAASVGVGGAQDVARSKLKHWIYFEISVFKDDKGAFKGEVLYADTQNGLEQGRRRHNAVQSATQALAAAVSKEIETLKTNVA